MLRFVLLAERIWSLPVSYTLSATALNQGIVQGSFDSPGIECGLLNFKVELNPMHKRNLDIFYSSLVSQLYFRKKTEFSLVSMDIQMHWF